MVEVHRETLADQVAQHLRNLIHERGLVPGDPIPTESEVIQELGVSRGIVREAFRSLSASGLINVSSGRRSTVGQLQSGVLEQFFSHALITCQADMDNLMTLRRTIEVSAAGLAAKNRTYGHLDQLKQKLDMMEQVLQDHEAYIRHDFDFHVLLCEASGNVLFRLLVEGLEEPVHDAMTAAILKRLTKEDDGVVQAEHERLFRAVEQGNVEAAEEAMRTHIATAVSAIRSTISSDGDLSKIRNRQMLSTDKT